VSWHYRDPRTFPARFPIALREAVSNLNEPIEFDNYPSEAKAEVVRATFRWYRWCLRQQPDVDRQLSRFEEIYQFRFSSEAAMGRIFLYLTAKPTILSTLRDLNPHIAGLFDDA
jgi:hypothetical protein